MKLFQINVVVNSGSTGRIAEELGEYAIEKGWESYIAYGRNKRPSSSVLFKIGTQIDFYTHVISTRVLDDHGFSSRRATKKLIRQIEEVNPDIIHLHNIHGYYINIRLLFEYLEKLSKPVVWTLHDCWAYTGHCAYYSFVNCQRWQTACYSCPQKNEYPKSLVMDRSNRNYYQKRDIFNALSKLTIVPVSKWLENELKKSFLSSKRIHQIYNGIDLNLFAPQNDVGGMIEKYNLSGKFVVLGVANNWLEGRKRLGDFLELGKRLKNQEVIVLVGLTNRQIEDLPENIIGIAHTESIKELASLYTLANVFINFSVEETFGMVSVEAMACGTPSIVYNCTATPEAISGGTGYVVEEGDVDAVVNILREIKHNTKSFYTGPCVSEAQRRFNIKDRTEEYMTLYNSLLEEKKV